MLNIPFALSIAFMGIIPTHMIPSYVRLRMLASQYLQPRHHKKIKRQKTMA